MSFRRLTIVGLALFVIVAGMPSAAYAAIPKPGTIEAASLNERSEFISGGAAYPTTTDDGGFVLFLSSSTDLPQATGRIQMYLRDMALDTVELVSVGAAEGGLNGDVDRAVIAGDGRYIVFVTDATNVITSFDTHGRQQAYRYDRITGDVIPVSRTDSDPRSGGSSSAFGISVSDDGDAIAFVSAGTILAATGANGRFQVYVRSVSAATTRLVSESIVSGPAGGDSGFPAISGNGRYVSWQSSAPDLIFWPRPNKSNQIYARDLLGGPSRMVSVGYTGAAGDHGSVISSVSNEGTVAFDSIALNLVEDAPVASKSQVYVAPWGGLPRLVSHKVLDSRVPTSAQADYPDISADGRTIVYQSIAVDLVREGGTGDFQVYAYDVASGQNLLVSRGRGSVFGDAHSTFASVSGDSTFVTFTSSARLTSKSPRGGTLLYVANIASP